jgi:hypothetical protein
MISVSKPIKKSLIIAKPPALLLATESPAAAIGSLIQFIREPLKVGDIPQEERYQEINGYPSFSPPSESARTSTARI